MGCRDVTAKMSNDDGVEPGRLAAKTWKATWIDEKEDSHDNN